MASLHLLHHAMAALSGTEEIRIDKGDVFGAHAHNSVDIGHNHFFRYFYDRTLVSRKHRAIRAWMRAATHGLDVAKGAAVPAGVGGKVRQPTPIWRQEALTLEVLAGPRSTPRVDMRGIGDRFPSRMERHAFDEHFLKFT